MTTNECIGKRLKSFRLKLGLSQAALAKRSGMTPSQLCKMELGHNGLTEASIRRLSSALGVSIAELLGEAAETPECFFEPKIAEVQSVAFSWVRVDDFLSGEADEVMKVVKERDEAVRAVAAGQAEVLPSSLQLAYGYGACEDAAELLARDMRNSLGIGCAPVVDLEIVLAMRGVEIVRREFAKQFQSASAYDLEAHRLLIVLNSANTKERNDYRLAYELGAAAVFAMSGFTPVRDDGAVHRLLRRFTAAFLMPEETVRADVARSGIAPDRWNFALLVMMKSHFAVSAEAYALRLESLGLIVPELRKRLRDRLREYYAAHPGAMEPQAEDRSYYAVHTELEKGCGK